MAECRTIRHTLLLAAIAGGFGLACGDSVEPESPSERFDQGSTTEISDPIEFVDISADDQSFDVRGETSIRTVLDVQPDSDTGPIWYGYGSEDPIPTGDRREFERFCDANFGNKAYEIDELPATIEGIVTLAPTQYEKVDICGEEQRYYGAYVLQDETGAVKILKDSEVADFQVGDRVRLDVLGVQKSFEMANVIAFDDEEVVAEADEANAPGVPYQPLEDSYTRYFECGRFFDAPPEDLGNSFRVSGRVCQEPTNRNFSQMIVQKGDQACDADQPIDWAVSLTAELGRRAFEIERGELITVTGPVYGGACSYGLEMLVTRPGQIQRFQ